MPIWTAEIKELERLHESFKGQLPDLEKELERLIKADDDNMVLLYSRRCLEVIITDLCECELKRPRKTEPLQGIIDKLHKEEKVPSHIIASMHGLNELSTYGAHPKDFDPKQVRTTLINLDTIIEWYLKHKEGGAEIVARSAEEIKQEVKSTVDVKKRIQIPRKKLTSFITGSILLIAIMVAVLFFTNIIGSGKQTKELEKSIAVLPFRNDSPDTANTYFINGLMEEVLNNLMKISDFRVLSRTSTEQYKGSNRPTIPEIAKKLGVSYIIEGSGQKYGNKFRLRVQLIKAKGKENHLWANSYEQELRETTDLFGIQSQIAQTIAKELKATITPEEKKLIEKVPTSNVAALDLYMKANDYLKEYEKTLDSNLYQNAVTFYKTALVIDPSYAKAYTGLARAYYDRNQWKTYFKENYLDSMLVLTNKAYSIDDELDEVYYLKGVYNYRNGQPEEALDNFDKALRINPNYCAAFERKGYILTWILFDFVRSIDNYNKALNLIQGNERVGIMQNLGLAYMNAGFTEKAKDYFEQAVIQNGDSATYFSLLAMLEFSKGNLENAILLEEKAMKLNSAIIPNIEWYSFAGQDQKAYSTAEKEVEVIRKTGSFPLRYSHRIGYVYWKAGKKSEARYYFNLQIKYGEESIHLGREYALNKTAHYDLAGVYAFLGDKVKAYQYLEELNKTKVYPLGGISYIKYDILFNPIRNEERFQKTLNNVETRYQAEHERVRKWLEEQGML